MSRVRFIRVSVLSTQVCVLSTQSFRKLHRLSKLCMAVSIIKIIMEYEPFIYLNLLAIPYKSDDVLKITIEMR